MAGLALALLLGGIVLLWISARTRAGVGLPAGRILSQDTGGDRRVGEPLYDPVLDLTGRPDYLIEHSGRLIPVEVKSGRSFAGPRLSHRLQLAAYCRLVEAAFARRPPHGLLQYADRSYTLPYDDDLEAELEEIIRAMRASQGDEQSRSHESPERCRACGYRDVCDQALA